MQLYKLTVYMKSADKLVHPVHTYYSDNKILLESRARYHMEHGTDYFGVINTFNLESSELVKENRDDKS